MHALRSITVDAWAGTWRHAALEEATALSRIMALPVDLVFNGQRCRFDTQHEPTGWIDVEGARPHDPEDGDAVERALVSADLGAWGMNGAVLAAEVRRLRRALADRR